MKKKAPTAIKLPILLFLFLSFISCREPNPVIIIATETGEIKVELYVENAPVTTANFLHLVNTGAYQNALFYRVVNDLNQPLNEYKIEVIQGGLYHDSIISFFSPIIHETTKQTGIKHLDGTISMARMEPGTASTEFFICIGNQPELDFGGKRNPDGQGFAAFGMVTGGMDIVKKIHSMENRDQYLVTPVRIVTVSSE